MPSLNKLALIFTAAAGITLGSFVTYKIMKHTGGDKSNKHKTEKTSDAKKVFNEAGVVTAVLMETYTDSTMDVRLHPWVGQFEMATVAIKGSRAAATSGFVAEVLDSTGTEIDAGSKGQTVFLRHLQNKMYTGPALTDAPQGHDVIAGPIKAHVIKLIDGDTFGVLADIGQGGYVVTHARVDGIDTPEKGSRAKCDAEAELAKKASALTASLVNDQDVTLYNVQFEKYGGRVLADIYLKDGSKLTDALIKKGLARPYDGGTKSSWCK